jgi:antitoxin (DNA-binding transcriptional repressor) of toxin-antitoxin stability system
MKMGVREFRERISDVVNGDELVVVTNNGRVVGEFVPASVKPATAETASWVADRLAFRERWRARNPDWVTLLAHEGMDEGGESFEIPTFR